ncbi:MAG: M23 family metallopeptidase [Deltaproteobacteria bacterium]|nr:MAG: M23 family metallopeptidase [Deltaproteobacteria bacterium]
MSELSGPASRGGRTRKGAPEGRQVLGSDPFAEPLGPHLLEERIEHLASYRERPVVRSPETPRAVPAASGSGQLLRRWLGRREGRPQRRRARSAIRRGLAVLILGAVAVGSVSAGLWVGQASQTGSAAIRKASVPPVGANAARDAAELDVAAPPTPELALAAFESDSTEIDAYRMAVARSEPLAPSRAVLARPLPRATRVSGEIEPGGTLSAALQEHGVTRETVDFLAVEVRPLFDFRYSRPGDRYSLVRDADGEVVEFRYAYSPIETIHLRREGSRYVASREEVRLVPRRSLIEGAITTSLYDAIVDSGESPQLAADFVNIFAWDVDFSHSTQPGDEFGALVERFYRQDIDGSELFVRSGRILAARYAGAAGNYSAVWFETQPEHGGYFRPDGTSVQREFLVAPVEYGRISSVYTHARRHPILKITRPHHGIDFAAPSGTPVWTVSDGVVTHRGWSGGFGRLIKVRHPNGYESYYAHLSRYKGGVSVGDRVSQKQVIGYVGQSGLATGPHVCFRIAKDGHYVNPANLQSPSGPPIPADRLPEFNLRRDALLLELEGAPTGRLANLQSL